MLQLALELFLLVLATTVFGFVAGYGFGRLRRAVDGKSARPAYYEVDADQFEENSLNQASEPARRIPDPAPPSASRRKRLTPDIRKGSS